MNSNHRGIVLVSTRVTEEQSYHEPRSALAHDYVTWFEARGWTVVPVPASTGDPVSYLELPGVSLVVLTGGNNVDPLLYGSPEEVPQVYPERDQTEYALIDGAVARQLPLWGVCRGLHTINVFFGGSLTPRVSGHVATDHLLVSSLPLLDGQLCNSYHNQAVQPDQVAPPLQVLAQSPDGMVEALVHSEHRIAAVQWHPERQDRSYDWPLLQQLLQGTLQ